MCGYLWHFVKNIILVPWSGDLIGWIVAIYTQNKKIAGSIPGLSACTRQPIGVSFSH